MSLQNQRPSLYLLELMSALIYLIIIYFLHSPVILLAQTVNIILILIVLFLVNRFIKSSGHVAILAGAVTILVFIHGLLYLLGFVLVWVLMWSRLILKRHTFKEVVVGAIIGIFVAFLVALIGKWYN